MQTLDTLLPEGERRGDIARERLALAYRNVFDLSNPDVGIVLADLVDYAGYYKVADYQIGALGLTDHNARRAVFGRIFHFLNLTDEERGEMEKAARRAAATSNREGFI